LLAYNFKGYIKCGQWIDLMIEDASLSKLGLLEVFEINISVRRVRSIEK